MKSSGTGIVINREVIIESPGGITVGNRVGINARCWISGGGGLEIGDDVLIGPGVTIVTVNHAHDEPSVPIREQGIVEKSVTNKKNIWIGSGVIILPGVTIHENVVIGAGSVVTKSVKRDMIYTGVPSKKYGEGS